MPGESSWIYRVMKQLKNECNRVRSIQHILSRKKHAALSHASNEKDTIPKFGTIFTEHMLQMEYDKSCGGWQNPKITPFENINLHPAAKVLHYATTLFEGMKAYRGVDGKIRLFRPQLNLQRLNQSAIRACLPRVDTHLLLNYLEKLINIDEQYIPLAENASLYIRPTLIGVDPTLGVSSISKALFYVILSPCGPYFETGSKPVRLYADGSYVRAWPGGCGNVKMGANYAPSVYVQELAAKKGCQQVLWLFGENEQLAEVGTMTIFAFYINDKGERELLTPPLDGTILPSITRRSLLEIARDWNEFNVVEKPITMKEIISMKKQNKLLELFGTGTACVVCPVSEILHKDQLIRIPTCEHINPIHQRFLKTLTDIQFGRTQHEWAHIIRSSNMYTEDYRMQLAY